MGKAKCKPSPTIVVVRSPTIVVLRALRRPVLKTPLHSLTDAKHRRLVISDIRRCNRTELPPNLVANPGGSSPVFWAQIFPARSSALSLETAKQTIWVTSSKQTMLIRPHLKESSQSHHEAKDVWGGSRDSTFLPTSKQQITPVR
jgi:hypothetical protein